MQKMNLFKFYIKISTRFDWFTMTIINIQILNYLNFTSYKIKQNKTLGIWTLKHTDITPTKSVQSLILISITINNIISFSSFQENDYHHRNMFAVVYVMLCMYTVREGP